MMKYFGKGLIALLFLYSCSGSQQDETMHNYTNKLIDESSPYLLQHAHNPVDWYPWGEEALEKAKAEDKLLIISIGYAACHWCHVMEKESFEDTAVARIMNEKYVAIKIDREERPDIDQVYMNAAQIYLSGGGGWPLNAIALPDGRPIFAGTYFPKDQWVSVLDRVDEFYRKNPDRAEEQAKLLTQEIQNMETVQLAEETGAFTKALTDDAAAAILDIIDYKKGGQRGAPKFPMPTTYEFLLKYHGLTGNEKALEAVTVTLDQMAWGGIYDQIGGGFARYSVDDIWKVPHFEKMLYDNGQLVSLYSKAYQLTKKELYKEVVYQTLEFVERELTDASGGFYSSLDADSEGEEGKFYVWTKEVFDQELGADADLIADYYNVTGPGNWEGVNILFRSGEEDNFVESHGLNHREWKEKINHINQQLLEKRAERVRPGLDDKILTGWNGLMLKGYVDAYVVFGEQKFLDAAILNAEFLLGKQVKADGSLYRNFKDGKSSINAFLDDYALMTEGLISLYQATFDERWLKEAKKLTDYVLQHFDDPVNQMFHYTSDQDPALIARKKEIADNVIASSNSVMANNLYLLGELYYDKEYIARAEQMLKNVQDAMVSERGAYYYANWNSVATFFNYTPYEIAIVGDDFAEKRAGFKGRYIPNALFMGGKDEGELPLLENKLRSGYTMIYVCQNKACKRPVEEVQEALELIQ